MKKTTILITMVFVFALVLGACTTPETAVEPAAEEAMPEVAEEPAVEEVAKTPDVIKIGFLTPLSGNNALYGQQVLAAAQMVADIINTANPDLHLALAADAGLPNLGGAQIEIVVADHKGDPAVAVAEAKRLITEENIIGLTGQFTSAMTKAVAVVTEQYQIPLLTAGSAVTLTDGSVPLEWLFRFGLNDSTFVKDSFAFLVMLNEEQNAGIKTIAVMAEDTEFGANIVPVVLKFADEFGFEVVENITYPANSTNLTAEVLKIKDADPDVMLMASYLSDAILFMKTIKEQNYTPKLIIGQRGGFIQTDFFDALGADTEYLLSSGGWSRDINSDVNRELIKLYPEYWEADPLSEGHVRDCTNVLFLALGVNQAGTTEAEALRAALRTLDVDMKNLITPGLGIEIDEYGQNLLATGVVMQVQNGEYATVYPDEFAAADAIFPMPAWGER